MKTQITRQVVIKSLFWKFLERGGSQAIQLIIQIILARVLMPEQFGLIAIVIVFVNIAQVFVQSGLGIALIRKSDADELDFSTTFYISLLIAFILYFILFFSSQFIASIYNQPLLENVLKVLGFVLFFGAINSVQNAYVAKNMLFHKLFVSGFISVSVSGTIGIYAAYNDFGIWALVIQQLSYHLVISLTLFTFVRWYPKRMFSLSRLRILYSFGWKILVSSLINVLYQDIRSLVIGVKYSAEDLAYYDRGKVFPNLLMKNVNGSIQSVLLPALSEFQNDKELLRSKVRRGIKTSSFVTMPMMFGLVIIASPLVKVLLTDTWLPAVPFIQILALTYSLWPMHTTNLQAINSMGRSDIFLKLEVIKVTISILILLGTVQYGVLAIAIGGLISSVIVSFVNAHPNKKLLGYSYLEQILDLLPTILLSLFMAVAISLFAFVINNSYLLLLFQIISGAIIYILLAYMFKFESFDYIYSILKEYKTKFITNKNKGDLNEKN